MAHVNALGNFATEVSLSNPGYSMPLVRFCTACCVSLDLALGVLARARDAQRFFSRTGARSWREQTSREHKNRDRVFGPGGEASLKSSQMLWSQIAVRRHLGLPAALASKRAHTTISIAVFGTFPAEPKIAMTCSGRDGILGS